MRLDGDVAHLSGGVYFGSRLSPVRCRHLSGVLGITEGSLPFTYLGVPLFRGAPRTRHLQALADTILARFAKWAGTSLSMAGRICLVQSVIHGSFVHSMMIYRWPVLLLRRMEAHIRNFVYTGDILKRTTVAVSWKRACSPKAEGGLGIRSLHLANRAFLSRLSWDILTLDLPYLQVFRSRFLREGALRSYVDSTIWFGFKDSYQALQDHSRWLVSRNSGVRFWLDNWLGYCIADRVEIPGHLRHRFEFTIADYCSPTGWRLHPDFCLAFPDIARDIRAYHLAPAGSDTRVWTQSRDGDISSAAIYHTLRTRHPAVDWGKWIWGTFIPPRRSLTIWRAIHDKLPTLDRLREGGFIGPSVCAFCQRATESLDHIFVGCPLVYEVWKHVFTIFDISFPNYYSFVDALLFAMRCKFSPQVSAVWRITVVSMVWLLWSHRNRCIFYAESFHPRKCLAVLYSLVSEANGMSLGSMGNTIHDLMILRAFRISGCPRPPLEVIPVRWVRPSRGWYKCNTDGSSSGCPGDCSAAGVFRDHHGRVVGCYVQHFGSGFAYEAELMAAILGIEFASRLGWRCIWLETDSTYVEGLLLRHSSQVPWTYRNRWLAALDTLRTMTFRVSHIYREGNSVADALASLAKSPLRSTRSTRIRSSLQGRTL